MDEAAVATWVEGYRKAWESNDPDDIGALFSDEALYYTEPYAKPWRGRGEIVRQWIENRDEPGDTTFEFQVEAIVGERAFVTGTTDYKTAPPRTYSNIWDLTLDDEGRATRFTEWWMKHPD